MKFIQTAMQATQDQKEITALLSARLEGYEPGRSFDNLRASMLTGEPEFCPREVVLIDLTKTQPKNQYVSLGMRVAFDQGQSLHEMVRNKWLLDVTVGDWKCRVCGSTQYFQMKPKLRCGKCHAYLWEYQEVRVLDEEIDVSGGLDTLLDFGAGGKITPVEIKTMDKDQFKTIVAPLAEHKQRTQLYLHLIKKSTQPFARFIDSDLGKLFYISKAFGTKGLDGGITPFKEFNVHYDLDAITTPLKKATVVKLYREGKTGIPVGICPNSMATRVKKCAVAQACWGGKYPGQS